MPSHCQWFAVGLLLSDTAVPGSVMDVAHCCLMQALGSMVTGNFDFKSNDILACICGSYGHALQLRIDLDSLGGVEADMRHHCRNPNQMWPLRD